MILCDRLRVIRESKQLSLEDIESRTGLSRSYVSRVESGHAVPSIQTLEKWAVALGVSVCQVFYEDEQPPAFLNLRNRMSAEDIVRASAGKMISVLNKSR
jgi:transcriptional regulator with XRE-family HTH domain